MKGVYFQWTNDPPNPRTKDWNVSELKVSLAPYRCVSCQITELAISDRSIQKTRGQIRRCHILEALRHLDDYP